MKKIYFWVLSICLVYAGILLRWIGTKNEYYDQSGVFHEMGPAWINGYDISAIGASIFLILFISSIRIWLLRSYFTPAGLILLMGVSIYEFAGATEYVDAHNQLRESLPFLAGGAGFIFLGALYATMIGADRLLLRKIR